MKRRKPSFSRAKVFALFVLLVYVPSEEYKYLNQYISDEASRRNQEGAIAANEIRQRDNDDLDLHINGNLSSSRILYRVFKGKVPPLAHVSLPFSCLVENRYFDPFGNGRNYALPSSNLNYTTKISTNLRILFVGDSVMHQIAVHYQMASGDPSPRLLEYLEGNQYSFSDGITVSTKTRGGGVVAYWRVLDLWTDDSESMKVAKGGSRRRREYASQLSNYTRRPGILTSNKIERITEGFDVVIHRIPRVIRSGPRQYSKRDLEQVLSMAAKSFAPKVVILVTGHLSDAVVTPQNWQELQSFNQLARDFSLTYTQPNKRFSVQHVFVADVAQYVEQLIQQNAERLGQNTTVDEIISDRLNDGSIIPAVCDEHVDDGASRCLRNALYFDGLHLCMNILGARVEAVISCLASCAYREGNAKDCERVCNKKYMSVQLLDDAVETSRVMSIHNDMLPQVSPEPPRTIKYQLYRGRPYVRSVHQLPYSCGTPEDLNKTNRTEFPPVSKGVFDFTTHVETDLNIMFIGDSVLHQLFVYFEGACGTDRHTTLMELPKKTTFADGASVARCAKDGGFLSFWRLLGLFSRTGETENLPYQGGGWRKQHLQAMKDYTYRYCPNPMRRSIDGFPAYDVVIHRLNHPWVQPESVTNESLQEIVDMAQHHLNPKVVIIITANFNNNHKLPEQVAQLREMNEKARTFSNNFRPARNDEWSVQHVLIVDVGRFVDELIEYNARAIGYRVSDSDQRYLFDRVKVYHHYERRYSRSMGMVCAEKRPPNEECQRNSLFNDGMHFCFETVGHRMYAVVACTIGCVYNNNVSDVKACEQDCNSKYMSLKPIDDGEILDA